jgi:hypothetical protein
VALPLAALLGLQRPGKREAAVAGVLVALVAWNALAPADDFARFERAWVFLLAGGLVVALAWRPPAAVGVVGTALLAVTLAALAGAVLMAVTRFSWNELQWLATRHYGAQVRLVVGALAAATAGTPAAADSTAAGSAMVDALERSANAMVRVVGEVLPAFVLVQSLAAIAVAWAIYQALAREPERATLPTMRDFRFNDHLIWGVVLALTALVIAPGLAALGVVGTRATGVTRLVGENLAVFFGSLYLMRGMGVGSAVAAAAGFKGPTAFVFGLVATLFLMPIVVAVGLALGVTDTWLDWRTRLNREKR